jgi:hypothetical protein
MYVCDLRHNFGHVLSRDVEAARARLEAHDTPTHRRELIRSAFSAIEGHHWQLKQDVLHHAAHVTKLTAHEYAALMEETYSVDKNGTVRSQPKFLPLLTSVRLVVSIVQRYRPEYEVDFQHVGWSNLRAAVDVRHRLVHPKQLEDLSVSGEEIEQTLSAFDWLLDLVLEVLRETHTHLQELQSGILKEAAPAGDADA